MSLCIIKSFEGRTRAFKSFTETSSNILGVGPVHIHMKLYMIIPDLHSTGKSRPANFSWAIEHFKPLLYDPLPCPIDLGNQDDIQDEIQDDT